MTRSHLIIGLPLIIIFLLGLFLRLYHLDLSPQHLNWDETALGYNAYSLMKTARDEYGRFLPLTLRSFNDYKGAIYTYLIIPVIPLFGLNEFSIRLPSALSGSLLIVVAYLWGKSLFSKSVGLFIALAISVSPYWLLVSRTAFESNLALFFLSLGTLLISSQKLKYIFLGIFLLMLSAYTYHSSKVIVPFILFYYLIWENKQQLISILKFQQKNLEKQPNFASEIPLYPQAFLAQLLFAILLGLPLVFLVFFDGGASRLSTTSITSLFPFIPTGIAQWQILSPYYLVNEILGRITAAFSPSFLFAIGSYLPGQKLPTAGIYQLWMIIPWFIGIIYLFKKRQPKYFLVHILLLLPAGLTWDWINPIRLLPGLAFHSLYIGIGINYLVNSFINTFSTHNFTKLKTLNSSYFFTFCFLLFTFVPLTLSSTIHTSSIVMSELGGTYRGDYQYGMKQVIEALQPYQDAASQVIIDVPHAQPYIFWLLNSQVDPHWYHQFSSQPGFDPTKKNIDIGKYHFRQVDWPIDGSTPQALILTSLINVSDDKINDNPQARLLQSVKDTDNNEIGRIIQIQ